MVSCNHAAQHTVTVLQLTSRILALADAPTRPRLHDPIHRAAVSAGSAAQLPLGSGGAPCTTPGSRGCGERSSRGRGGPGRAITIGTRFWDEIRQHTLDNGADALKYFHRFAADPGDGEPWVDAVLLVRQVARRHVHSRWGGSSALRGLSGPRGASTAGRQDTTL